MEIVFFDLETGGLDPNTHPIIQAAFLATEALEEVDSLEVKIHFDAMACDETVLFEQKNSYDPDVWAREALPEAEALMRIQQFLRDHSHVKMVSKRTGKPYQVAQLAGHNAAKFDGPFLQAWFSRNDQFLPASYRVLDTLQLAMWELMGVDGTESFSLVEIAERLGFQLEDAHDALADVRATAALTRRLLRRQQGLPL